MIENQASQQVSGSPIVICGMHRSGTSIFTQVLSECGLYLGNDNDLMSAHPIDNPSGYFEYKPAIEFSDRLLQEIGISWSNPQKILNRNWLRDIDLKQAKSEIREIFSPLTSSGRIWGWKDPRVTILLPFWRSIFPELKIILCVRNPLEVAISLSKRHISHVDFYDSLELWLDYYQEFLRWSEEVEFLITHYESLFYNADGELTRLYNFAGLMPSEANISASISRINPDLHRVMVPENLLHKFSYLPEGLLKIYDALCSNAGENYHLLTQDIGYHKQKAEMFPRRIIEISTNTFDSYFQKISEKNIRIDELFSEIAERDERIRVYSKSLWYKMSQLIEKIKKFLIKTCRKI